VSKEQEEPGTGDAAQLVHVRSLSARGSEAVSALIAMLDAPSWSVRREVVVVLAGLGDAAVPALVRCLESDRGSEARIAANVDALAGSSGSSVESVLSARAEHADPAFLSDIAQILGRRRSSSANELLRKLTLHADDNVAVSAIEALGRLGGRAAVDALIACVQSKSFFRTFPAIDVLGRSGDPRAVEPLLNLLDSGYTLEAARALGRSAARRAIAPLAGLLLSRADSSVRVACVALMELRDRHAQLYGSSSAVTEALERLASEAAVRRIAESAARGDKLEKIAACRLLGELKIESATPFLLPLLDAEPDLSEAAAKALLEIGRASESALLAAFAQGDSRRRASLLPVVTSPRCADAVLQCLSDPSVDVRVLACEALARTGIIAAVPRLFELLSDERQRIVHAAVAALQSLGSDQTEALALRAASSEHQPTRRAALRVLSYFGFASALPIFAAAIHETDLRVRSAALHGLALLDVPAASELLLATARDSDPAARAGAVRALGQVARDASTLEPSVRDCLLLGLRDPDPWVRYYACQALGKLGLAAGEDAIRALLRDEAGQVRVAAVEALSHMKSTAAIETLREFARDPDLDMRRAALLGLGLSGDRDALPVISEAVATADPATRLVALSAVAGLAGEGVVPILVMAAQDATENVRVAALRLLAERPGREAGDALISLLDRLAERSLLMSALAAPVEGRLQALEAALGHADDDRALLLVSCLTHSKSEGAATTLLRTLASPNPAARKAAVSALAVLGTHEARGAVEQLSRSDPDADVRSTCLLSLAY
jgi:HEAT repeat protein